MTSLRKGAVAVLAVSLVVGWLGLRDLKQAPPAFSAHATANDTTVWAPAGQQTKAVVVAPDGSIYYGGSFSQVAPYAPYGTPVSISTGSPKSIQAKMDGTTRVAVADGTGGWYIGGDFTNVNGDSNYAGLAHIKSNGHIDTSFQVPVGGQALALVLNGSTLYVGGNFMDIDGQTRNNLAAVDVSSGTVTAWDPNVDGAVNALALDAANGVLYAGGYYSNVGGEARSMLVGLDTTDGTPTSWMPTVDSNVDALALDATNGVLYVGGSFFNVNDGTGSVSQSNLAAFTTEVPGGLVTAFNPAPNNGVKALALNDDGSVVYVGGEFGGTIGGQSRNYLAALTTADGLATAWNPNPNGFVYALARTSTSMYVGGGFATIGGASRPNVAVVSTVSGSATSWNPKPSGGNVLSIALDTGTGYAFVAGEFMGIGLTNRAGLAHVLSDGTLDLTFNPAPGDVNELVLDSTNNLLYVGGNFPSIGGQTRHYVAAVSTATGLATSWNPNADAEVTALLLDATNGLVYVGGGFDNIGGAVRSRLAAISTSTGLATAWNPNLDAGVLDLALNGTTLYVAGEYSSVGGNGAYANLSAISTATGVPAAWDPNPNGAVYKIALDTGSGTLYAGGTFTSIGGQSRNYLGALSTTTALATSWDANITGDHVEAIALDASADLLYVGGYFSQIGGASQSYLAAVQTSDGLSNGWAPQVTATAIAISYAGANLPLAVGGTTGFSTIDLDQRKLAVYPPVGVLITESGGSTTVTEGGATDTYTVVLMSKPSVSVSIAVGGDTQVSVSPVSLTFTTDNWDVPQTVTVTAIDDAVEESTHTGTITHAPDAFDLPYSAVTIADVVATVTDNDHHGGGSPTPVTPGPSPDSSLVRVVTPNGGEQAKLGSPLPLMWSYTGRVDLVNVQLSRDNGTTWETLASGVSSAATPFAWTVVGPATTQALVRVQATDLASVLSEDVSDATFSIVDPAAPVTNNPNKEADITEPIDKAHVAPGEPVEALSPVTGKLEAVEKVRAGEFVRSPSFPAVYFITEDLKRRPFLDEATYSTYASSFDVVRFVTDATMTVLPLAPAMTPKAGLVFVKTPTDPRTFSVSDGPTGQVLHWIVSEEAAQSIAGPAWAEYVVDVPESVLSKYAVGEPVGSVAQTAIDPAKLRRRLDLKLQKIK